VRARALDGGSAGEVLWLLGAVVVSLALHLSLAAGVSRIPEREREEPVWVEMAVATVEPAPVPEPPPPPPEPEPAPQPKKPEVVDYHPEPQPAPPTPPPPDPKPAPRPIQGLSNDSFLPGQGNGFDAAHGNTTAAKATGEKLALGEDVPFQTLPFASVTTPPKNRYKGEIEVPASVKEAGLQGRVELLLTIDVEGRVTDIEVVESLSPDADAACKAALARSRWKPGDKDGVPVVTRGVPYTCRFEQTSD
jgi:protein TonB